MLVFLVRGYTMGFIHCTVVTKATVAMEKDGNLNEII